MTLLSQKSAYIKGYYFVSINIFVPYSNKNNVYI